MSRAWAIKILPVIGILILFFCFDSSPVIAEDQIVADSPLVQQTIQDKKNSIQQLDQQIQEYQKKIEEKQSEQTTLANALEILQNRIEKSQLEINETRAHIDITNAEIANAEQNIAEIEKKLERQKELISSVVQRIQGEDNSLPVELFYGTDRFSALLDTVQKLGQINSDLGQAVTEAKNTRNSLEVIRADELMKRDQLKKLEQALEEDQVHLTDETEAKQIVLDTTQQSEKRFQKLLQDLKQEQTFVQNQVRELQTRLEDKISESDKIGGGLLSWPVEPGTRRVSAYFHDPTYPFRNLFEHPGIDIPKPFGTPIHSAAAGYVAWTRRGAQYGNYVMVIHSDGIATLYAHLSRIDVIPDQFIARGGKIGLVGMTGLTTGPHLHFEVRKEGIPTDPMTYLQTQ